MKIAVFGATGGIGKFVVEHALKEGYEVVAYVRTPNKLNISDDNLKVMQGELNEYEKIKLAIEGCDCVINTVGVPMKFSYKEMDGLTGCDNIIKAMKELNVKRLIAWATPTVKSAEDSKSVVTVLPGIMAGIVFPKAKKEILAIGQSITKSNLDWTIVRFLAPKDTAFTSNVKVTFGEEKINFNISREDIAYFMVKQVTDKTYVGRMPIIGS